MANEFGDKQIALAQFGQKLRDKDAAAQAAAQPAPPVEPAPTAQPITNTTLPPTEPVVTPPAATAPEPVVQAPSPAVDPATTTTNPPAAPVEELVEWDKDVFEPQPTLETSVTIEALGSALKLDGVKSKEDLVAHFTTQQAKIKELETAQTSHLDGLDDDLKEVVRIAKEKGDWKGYLSTAAVDYSNVDPVALFEQEVDRQFTKNGVYDKEGADAAIAEIPEAYKRLEGSRLKQNLIDRQANRRQEILRQQETRRQEFGRGVAEATKSLSQTLPKDKYGITFEPKHSDFIYEGIRNGSLIKKHFGNIDISNADPAKLVKAVTLAEWGEKIAKFNADQGKVKGMKEVLKSAQNVQLSTPPVPPTPIVQGEKPKTAADKLRESRAAMQTPGRL